MKRSLLALAVLGAFASAASAQSSVTLYGRVDLSVGKPMGTSAKYLGNGSGSRLGVRGVEDLGGGLQALFNIEHRYEADTGVSGSGAGGSTSVTAATPYGNQRFWHGRSIVGLQGGFGQVVFGREYTTSFLQSQLVADPWGYDTVVSNNGIPAIIGLGIGTVRLDSSATYKISFAGFTFGAQIAEATDTFTNVNNKPVNLALSYAAGPITAGFGFERTGAEITEEAQLMTLNAAYNFGAFKIGGMVSRGTTATNLDRQGWLVTATAPIGAGEFRAGFGRRQDDQAGGGDITTHQIMAAGYHYSMSKRTTLYADFVRNSKAATSKAGYDFGIKHNF